MWMKKLKREWWVGKKWNREQEIAMNECLWWEEKE